MTRFFGACLQKLPLRLLAFTVLAILVHGYHLGADDSAIYIPAIKQVADPSLYPFGAQFFLSHAHLSFFSNLVGGSARLSGLPINLVIFLWHGIGIFLLLLADWQLLTVCFRSDTARWGGVVLLAAVFSVPVAGTALVIMDPYLTARSLSTPATLFAVVALLQGRWRTAAVWLLITAAIHPQMAVYAVVFGVCLVLWQRWRPEPPQAVAMTSLIGLPFLFDLHPATGAAREALFSRTYFFVYNWEWYEWVGALVPLAILWWLSRVSLKTVTSEFRRIAGALVPFGLMFTAAAILLASLPRLENYNRLQPMRSLHVVYVVFFALLGGLLAEYLLKARWWRWAVLFVPLAVSMWLLGWSTYPDIAHVDWPGLSDGNSWTLAFAWIRGNTPKTAVFALDPQYMQAKGEDMRGFRAIAERSVLADNVKDSGAVSLFPRLAPEWKAEVSAQTGWSNFHRADFETLAAHYPVTWILTARPFPPDLPCPYTNRDLAVCRIK